MDVSVVEARKIVDGKQSQNQYEIDFIASNGMDKYYIREKKNQELKPLPKIADSCRKIVIIGMISRHTPTTTKYITSACPLHPVSSEAMQNQRA